jgi:hypothetical protein
VVHSTAERHSVANTCLSLQAEFSATAMREAMAFVRDSIDSVVRDMKDHIDEKGEIKREGLYGPYHFLALIDPADKREEEHDKSKRVQEKSDEKWERFRLEQDSEQFKVEQKKFENAQLRCFAADYLYRGKEKGSEPDAGSAPAAIVQPDDAHDAPPHAQKKTTRDALDEYRRAWSSIYQR